MLLPASGLAGLVLLLAGAVTPALAAADPLALSSVSVSPTRVLTLVAGVPTALGDLDLPSTDFTATQGGHPVPVQATRVLAGPVELVLVLDASDGPTLAVEQAAAADLLRALPPATAVTVLPGATRATAGTAFPALAAVRVSGGGLLDGLPAAATVRRLAVVLTGCSALDAETRVLPASQVSVLAIGDDCSPSATRLAGPAAGVLRTGLDTGGLLAGVDEVSRGALGQYEVRSTGPVAGGPVEVTLRNGTVVATGTAPLPAAPSSPTGDGSTGDSGRSPWPAVLAAALALVAAAALGAELRARRVVPR